MVGTGPYRTVPDRTRPIFINNVEVPRLVGPEPYLEVPRSKRTWTGGCRNLGWIKVRKELEMERGNSWARKEEKEEEEEARERKVNLQRAQVDEGQWRGGGPIK